MRRPGASANRDQLSPRPCLPSSVYLDTSWCGKEHLSLMVPSIARQCGLQTPLYMAALVADFIKFIVCIKVIVRVCISLTFFFLDFRLFFCRLEEPLGP